MTLLLDVFPARVDYPVGAHVAVRAVVTDGDPRRLHVFGEGPRLLISVPVDTSAGVALRGNRVELTGVDGTSWTVSREGRCGCGSRLKRLSVDALLALLPT